MRNKTVIATPPGATVKEQLAFHDMTQKQWRMLLEVVLRLYLKLYPPLSTDWNRSDHPQGPDGRFIGKGSSAENTHVQEGESTPAQKSSYAGRKTVERDLKRQKTSSIKKAIASFEKQIASHEEKLKDPAKYDATWNMRREDNQKGLLKHWQKEIDNFHTSIERRREELKRRGET